MRIELEIHSPTAVKGSGWSDLSRFKGYYNCKILFSAKIHPDISILQTDGALFSAEEIRELHSIPAAKSFDSKFLRRCIEMLYVNNLNVLKIRSIKGVQHTNDGIIETLKLPITPEKLTATKHHFADRINRFAHQMNPEEVAGRLNDTKVNQLLARAIYNINEKSKSKIFAAKPLLLDEEWLILSIMALCHDVPNVRQTN